MSADDLAPVPSDPAATDVDEHRLTAWCVYDLVAGRYLEQTFRTREPSDRQRRGLQEAIDATTGAARFEWRRV